MQESPCVNTAQLTVNKSRLACVSYSGQSLRPNPPNYPMNKCFIKVRTPNLLFYCDKPGVLTFMMTSIIATNLGIHTLITGIAKPTLKFSHMIYEGMCNILRNLKENLQSRCLSMLFIFTIMPYRLIKEKNVLVVIGKSAML